MTKFLAFALLSLALCSASADAQAARLQWKLDSPARLVTGQDSLSPSSWLFEEMAPGWHVTTGPGVLLFDSTRVATGQYSVESLFYLFPNPPETGSGVFIAAQNVGQTTVNYLLFQVRRDGRYSILHQMGATSHMIRDWTADTAIVVHPGGSEVIANRVRVTVSPDSMVLTVNQKRVTAISRAGVQTNGVFGLRIGPGTNAHVASLDLVVHLAPRGADD